MAASLPHAKFRDETRHIGRIVLAIRIHHDYRPRRASAHGRTPGRTSESTLNGPGFGAATGPAADRWQWLPRPRATRAARMRTTPSFTRTTRARSRFFASSVSRRGRSRRTAGQSLRKRPAQDHEIRWPIGRRTGSAPRLRGEGGHVRRHGHRLSSWSRVDRTLTHGHELRVQKSIDRLMTIVSAELMVLNAETVRDPSSRVAKQSHRRRLVVAKLDGNTFNVQ